MQQNFQVFSAMLSMVLVLVLFTWRKWTVEEVRPCYYHVIGVLSLDCTLVLTHKMLECDVQVSIWRSNFLFFHGHNVYQGVGRLCICKDGADMKPCVYIYICIYSCVLANKESTQWVFLTLNTLEIQSTLPNYSVNMIDNTDINRLHFLPIAADINECQRNTHNCNVSATCTNTPGSFNCTCNLGYTGDGVVRCDGKIWLAHLLCSH